MGRSGTRSCLSTSLSPYTVRFTRYLVVTCVVAIMTALAAEVMKTAEFKTKSVRERSTYASQLCDIVVALHRCGIVMLDFKPSNVMIKGTGVIVMKAIDADSWRLAHHPIGAITDGGLSMLPDFTPVYAAIEVGATHIAPVLPAPAYPRCCTCSVPLSVGLAQENQCILIYFI